MKDEASYVCDTCGEEIVVPIDLSAGSEQEYVEDCPVCCRPNVVHVEMDDDGDVRVWAEREQGRHERPAGFNAHKGPGLKAMPEHVEESPARRRCSRQTPGRTG